MALSFTVKVIQIDGKPDVLVYLDDNEALQSVTGLMLADDICEIQILIRHPVELTRDTGAAIQLITGR